jgi:hypothetical protein
VLGNKHGEKFWGLLSTIFISGYYALLFAFILSIVIEFNLMWGKQSWFLL